MKKMIVATLLLLSVFAIAQTPAITEDPNKWSKPEYKLTDRQKRRLRSHIAATDLAKQNKDMATMQLAQQTFEKECEAIKKEINASKTATCDVETATIK